MPEASLAASSADVRDAFLGDSDAVSLANAARFGCGQCSRTPPCLIKNFGERHFIMRHGLNFLEAVRWILAVTRDIRCESMTFFNLKAATSVGAYPTPASTSFRVLTEQRRAGDMRRN